MNRLTSMLANSAAPGVGGQTLWINPATGIIEWINLPMVDDFACSGIGTGGLGWTTTVANSGTVVVGGNTQGHFGTVNLNTNTLSNGTAVLRTVANSGSGGGRKHILLSCVKTPALSNGTDRYQLWFGFGNSTGSKPTSGIFFDYIDNVSSGIWVPTTGNGGAYSTATGGTNVTVEANTWYWLYIEYDGVIAKFWIGKDQVGLPGQPGALTYAGACTTNLPTANQYGLNYVVAKSVGTTGVSPIVDKVILSV